MKKILKNWEDETELLATYFINRYFGNDTEHYWVCDEIGSVLVVNDYFFNVGDMVEFIRGNYSKDKMFEYYDYSLRCHEDKKSPINIKTYRNIRQ